MIKMFRVLIISIFVLFVINGLFTSCKTKKQVFHFKNVKPMRAVKVFDNVEYRKFRYHTLSLKFSATYEKDGESQSFNGTIRIKKDSIIWISIVPALGIEAARFLITPDSIKFINRINSTYYSGNYNYVRNLLKTDLDFEMLQDILGNDMFFYNRSDDDDTKGYKCYTDSNLYLLQSIKERKVNRKIKKKKTTNLVFVEISVIPQIFKISNIHASNFEYEKSLDVSYSEFENIEDQLFPKQLNFVIKDRSTVIKFDLNYSKITLNKDLECPFSIPEKYKKIAD